jgi:hypothetical protein
VPEFLRQLPFLCGVFGLAYWLFPDDVLAGFIDDIETMDLFYLALSIAVFAIGLTLAFLIVVESRGVERLPERQ